MLSLLDKALELHGDRVAGDDPGVLGGLAWRGEQRCVFLGTLESSLTAMGARKSRRLVAVAESLGVPVVLLGMMPVAYGRLASEDSEALHACADLAAAFTSSAVPIVAVFTHVSPSAGSTCVFDAVVALASETCDHPTCVEYAADTVADQRVALLKALADVGVLSPADRLERRMDRLGLNVGMS